MQKYFLGLFLLLSTNSIAQKKYFQQEANHKIEVSLDDVNHILRGFETINYTNNSTDTLNYIFFHLYPNAYKNDKSEFTKQQVENKTTEFYYSKDAQRGFIDSLDFKVNGEHVNVNDYLNQEDVVLVELIKPLLPNSSITITTPFRVQIPEVFSRLGHSEQNYQITQWYPKPAVYDLTGWHPMPYLDQGEFYSEFGNYEVSITLPSNYVVAATGMLQTNSEIEFLSEKCKTIDSTKSKIDVESDSNLKTILFKQNNVHDFAWFADKRFNVEQKKIKLKNGQEINCFSYYKPENYKFYHGSSDIIQQTISYLSEHVGTYPYGHASVVDGSLKAGGGMEYPMITVVSEVHSKSELQTIIIHEVGHNWFQGMLASNERENPWMDEGINSFYEKVIDEKITNSHAKIEIKKSEKLSKKLNGNFLYLLTATENLDQASNSKATDFTSLNYGADLYLKTALSFAYLKEYLGDELFDNCMKTYFKDWNLKHPQPNDLRKIFEKNSTKNLDWFFDDLLNSTKKIDFKLNSVKKQDGVWNITAKSKTNFKGPIPIEALTNDSIVSKQWIEYPYDTSINLTQSNQLPITSIQIDSKNYLPEINIANNKYRTNSLLHRFNHKLKIGTLAGPKPTKNLFLLPAFGYNYYDKFMLGGVIHNLELPNNTLQFAIAPLYSTNTKQLVGTGAIGYTIHPNRIFRSILISLSGRIFHENMSQLNIDKPIFAKYIKLAPSVDFDFNKKTLRSQVSDNINLRFIHIQKQGISYQFNATDSLFEATQGAVSQNDFININFNHANKRTFNPFSYNIEATANESFVKLGLTSNARVDYHLPKKSLHVRFFAGKYIELKSNSDPFEARNQYLNATYINQNDFLYDDIYIARNEQSKGLVQQISMREGGFKIRTPQYANPIGMSNNWLTAINLRSDIPIKLPFKLQVFADFGTFADAGKLNSSGNKSLFDAGLELHLIKDVIIIYAPLLMSKDFKDYTKQIYTKNRFANSMSFSLNLNHLNLLKSYQLINLISN